MAKTSKEFYEESGVEKLAARKKKKQHIQELVYLKKLLKKNKRFWTWHVAMEDLQSLWQS